MSCMCNTKVTVPAGVFVHASAGDTWSPACVYFAGICPPSGNAVVVSVIGLGGGPPAAGCCALAANTPETAIDKIRNQSRRRISTSPRGRTIAHLDGGCTDSLLAPRRAGYGQPATRESSVNCYQR